MKLILAALLTVGTVIANPILDAASADLDAKIKAIDDSSFYERILSFSERRRLQTSTGALSQLSTSMNTLFSQIASEKITSATEVIDTYAFAPLSNSGPSAAFLCLTSRTWMLQVEE